MFETQPYLSRHNDWRSESDENRFRLPNSLSKWLLDKGSLTAALTTLSNGDFQVKQKWQEITSAHTHEQAKLNLSVNQTSLIREVELCIYDEAVVFARSIIPLDLTGGNEDSLENLGTKPLGHLLFKDGNIRVSKRDFAKIKTPESIIFARRTPYDYLKRQILVSEFFLPTFEKYLMI